MRATSHSPITALKVERYEEEGRDRFTVLQVGLGGDDAFCLFLGDSEIRSTITYLEDATRKLERLLPEEEGITSITDALVIAFISEADSYGLPLDDEAILSAREGMLALTRQLPAKLVLEWAERIEVKRHPHIYAGKNWDFAGSGRETLEEIRKVKQAEPKKPLELAPKYRKTPMMLSVEAQQGKSIEEVLAEDIGTEVAKKLGITYGTISRWKRAVGMYTYKKRNKS